jgi:hypothetical protein
MYEQENGAALMTNSMKYLRATTARTARFSDILSTRSDIWFLFRKHADTWRYRVQHNEILRSEKREKLDDVGFYFNFSWRHILF